MTKPKGGSHIGNQHFKFLTMKGAGRNSLTTSETKRFIGICKKLLMCGNWNKKVDKEIFYKSGQRSVVNHLIEKFKLQGEN